MGRRGIALAMLGAAVGALTSLACMGPGASPDPDLPVGASDGPPHREGPVDDRTDVLPEYVGVTGHAPLPPSVGGDWRSGPGRDELPQSFGEYRDSRPVRATAARGTIVLQPLTDPGGTGDSHADWTDTYECLRRFCAAFFACPVELGPPIELLARNVRVRTEGTRAWRQHHAGTVMDKLLLRRLPRHAICYLGITIEDLYPRSDWNYVFGQAYLAERVGVYSLARYQPQFWGERDSPDARKLALLRALKVLAHETGHMFGLPHCLYFACCMNGSNSLAEADRQPLWYCPVCDSKITWNRSLDPVARFRALALELRAAGLDTEAAWYEARHAELERKAQARAGQ